MRGLQLPHLSEGPPVKRKTPVPEFPALVASKIRVRFDHARLDMALRLRIKAKPHYKGTFLKPLNAEDAEAVEWIRAQVTRHGTMAWGQNGHGRNVKWGWSKRLSNLEKVG